MCRLVDPVNGVVEDIMENMFKYVMDTLRYTIMCFCSIDTEIAV